MKKITALILSLAVFCSLFTFSVSADEHWAQKSAEALIEKGIVSGYSDGSLKLDNTITRAEFVKIINKTMGYEEKAEVSFPDVKEDKWYYGEMLAAKKEGYITGDENNNANPEANITRAEASVILSRILKLDLTETNADIKDLNEIPDWAKASIIALFNKGIIKGYEDGTFKYGNTLTRGEAFSLIVKVNPENEEEPKDEPKEEAEEKDNPFISESGSASGGSNVSVSQRPASGGGGSGGGGGGGAVLPKIATVPKLKYNKDISEYTLAWGVSTGAKDYNIKISLEGEEDYIISNYEDTTIELYRYFTEISANRTNAEETFEVSVMANGKSGYKNSAYSNTVTLSANFESIETPVLAEKNGVAGGIHRVIITWDDVLNNAGYQVEIVKSDNTALTPDVDYTYDTENRKVVIPDTTCCDDNTEIKVIALSPDKQAYKDSAPVSLKIPVSSGSVDVYQDGSLTSPWIITSAEQIEAISDPSNTYGYEMDDHYVITKNITVTKPIYSKVYYSSGQKADTTFKGSIKGKLNGSDYKPTITLNIGSETEPYLSDSIAVGFVNYLDGGEISNLNFEGTVNVTFKDGLESVAERSGVGSAVGYAAKNSKITNCTNSATVTGPYLTGGIVGYVTTVTLNNCTNYGNVSGTSYVGGISAQGGVTMSNCHNYGDISGVSYVGGIAGSSNNSTFTSCSNHGTVTATSSNAAGLVAWSSGNYKFEALKCFNAGDVYVKKGAAAGLFGATYRTKSTSYKTYKFTFTDCYNTGKLYDLDGNEEAKPSFVHTLGYAGSAISYGITRVYSTNPVANFIDKKCADLLEYDFSHIYVVGDLCTNGDVTNQVGIEEADLINLVADNSSVFTEAIWISDESGEYKYPQLVNNLHIKEKESIPGFKKFEASVVKNGEAYDINYTWELPLNVKALSIKIVNNTDIEDVTSDWITLDHEDISKAGYTLEGAKENCYYEIFTKLEYEDDTAPTEMNLEVFVPIM